MINNLASQTTHLKNVSGIPWEIDLAFEAINHGVLNVWILEKSTLFIFLKMKFLKMVFFP